MLFRSEAGVGVANLLIIEGESSAELDGSSLPPLVVEAKILVLSCDTQNFGLVLFIKMLPGNKTFPIVKLYPFVILDLCLLWEKPSKCIFDLCALFKKSILCQWIYLHNYFS